MTQSNVDAVLKLSREIFHLEQQERSIRARREAKKAELARLLAGEAAPAEAERSEFRAGSLPARVLELLVAETPNAMTADALARVVARDVNSIRTVLSRLKALGHVEKIGRGEYRATLASDETGTEPSGGIGAEIEERKEDKTLEV